MKKVKFTLGLVLSFLLTGVGVSVNATDYIIIGPGSTLGGSVTVDGASAGKQTIINAEPADNDTICIKNAAGEFVPITSVKFTSSTLTQSEVDEILKAFKEGDKDLVSLDMGNNDVITTLDLSGFDKLTSLTNLSGGVLKTLNLSGCSALINLSCNSNSLESLDVTDCASLKKLDCSFNKLTSLDVTSCSSLESLDCSYDNILTSLNVAGCSYLDTLNCGWDLLSSLDLTGCSSLRYLDCINSDISLLDLTGTKVYIPDEAAAQEYKQLNTQIIIKVNPDNPYVGEQTVLTNVIKVIKDENYKFNIDWEIVDTDGNILSSKGNEKDGLAIEVQGSSVKDANITFSVRSNFIYTISAIRVVSYGYTGGLEEFHAVSFTGFKGDGSDKTGSEYKFVMPEGNVKITLRVNAHEVLPDPIVLRTVQIVANDIETSPKATAGFHYVEGHKDFTFSVYSEKEINVTTNRGDVIGDGILISKNDDGSWKVTVRKVSTNLVITVTESTTGNDAVGKDAVWAANGALHIKSVVDGVVSIYNLTGQLYKQVSVSGDETFTLPKGIYIVQLNGKAYKIKN